MRAMWGLQRKRNGKGENREEGKEADQKEEGSTFDSETRKTPSPMSHVSLAEKQYKYDTEVKTLF